MSRSMSMNEPIVSCLAECFEVWASEKIALRTFRNVACRRRRVYGESDEEIFLC